MPLPHPAPAPEPAPSAFTKHADLTPDQRARYGGYVLAKERAGEACEANRRGNERAAAALNAAGGDKLAALELMLAVAS